VYLCSTLGEENVNLIEEPEGAVIPGKVNLVPLCFADKLKEEYDMFISTWALSECNKEAQDFVLRRKIFGANKILMANQKSDDNFPYAENLQYIMKNMNPKTEDIDEVLKGNTYIFV